MSESVLSVADVMDKMADRAHADWGEEAGNCLRTYSLCLRTAVKAAERDDPQIKLLWDYFHDLRGEVSVLRAAEQARQLRSCHPPDGPIQVIDGPTGPQGHANRMVGVQEPLDGSRMFLLMGGSSGGSWLSLAADAKVGTKVVEKGEVYLFDGEQLVFSALETIKRGGGMGVG